MMGYHFEYVEIKKNAKILKKFTPKYPKRALQKGLSGYVVVEFGIDENGKSTNVIVLESSNKTFEKESLKAARKQLYQPVVLDGEVIEGIRLTYKFVFTMADENGKLEKIWEQKW